MTGCLCPLLAWQLCWHAFEHDEGAFILAVIWNTTNRQLLSTSSASGDGRPAEYGGLAKEEATEGVTSSDAHPAEYVGLTMQEAESLQRKSGHPK